MIIPEEIRDGIRDRLWATADGLGWSALDDAERSRYYEAWTRDRTIGGQLAHFMDPRKVRVYIKDSLVGFRAELSRFFHREVSHV